MSTSREDRIRLRAARVLIDGRLIAVNARVHGTRSVADGHGCQCDPCRKVQAKRSYSQRQSRKGREGVPTVALKKCGRKGCRKQVPYLAGDTPSRYRRRAFHEDACRNLARIEKLVAIRRARAPWVSEVRRCQRDGCDERYTPTNKGQRYHDHACSVLARASNRRRDTKVCACPCRQTFERPANRCGTFWEGRQYIDIEHRKRAGYHAPKPERSPLATVGKGGAEPGAARAGGRRAPSPVPSKDRRREAPPTPTVAREPIRFGQVPTRERVTTIERSSKPRPSFGLSRRAG